MVMLKLSAVLLAYVLVICQMYSSHAAPSRTSSEPVSDQVTLTNYDAQRILNAIFEEIMQMSSEEQEQHATERNSMDRPMSKRCTSLSTCVLGRLSQDIHRLQTYPHTDVGAGTPGKKSSLPECYANDQGSFN